MQDNRRTTLDDFITPDEIVQQYPNRFTHPQITWLLRNRHKNGLEKAEAVVLVGRRFYINKSKFVDWLKKH